MSKLITQSFSSIIISNTSVAGIKRNMYNEQNIENIL